MPNLHRVTMILIQAEAAKLILKGLRGAKTLMGISHPNSDKMILILDKGPVKSAGTPKAEGKCASITPATSSMINMAPASAWNKRPVS